MKKRINTGILTLAIIIFGAGVTHAQTKSSWIPTKGVQRIANKKLYTSEEVKASHIEARSTTIPDVVVSKKVQRISNRELMEDALGNIESRGYPTWTISKPLHRREKE